MTITPEMKNELANIVQQAMEQHEQHKTAAKTVYRCVCADFDEELHSFDYSNRGTFINCKGVERSWDTKVPCWQRIRGAIGTLLRSVYQVDSVTKLPPEKEADMRQFMRSVLELMKNLKG